MQLTTIGIDLAKNVFQVHGVDKRGKAVLRKPLKRHQVLPFFANLDPCLIGMEACGSAHHWARRLSALGHTVKLMAPQFVKPYVKTNKHDAADAEAICAAMAQARKMASFWSRGYSMGKSTTTGVVAAASSANQRWSNSLGRPNFGRLSTSLYSARISGVTSHSQSGWATT